ncbi:hypothetical protein AVEN_49445-1 [Araneus ventricosus]|uniref:Tc1-like transposase DDE domain-containing protein n=1 Tax=Araneus ventricosus TaxID=182803 RepID=A0A4Y2CQW9_ARAVE|nr:hypothetical protein AVEN_49445-1 [Araneus ventricosus]
MNSNISEKWAREKLIPNLPENAVVNIDNAPYHSVQINKIPNSIIHSPGDLKVDLLQLVKLNTPKFKTYKFDLILQEHGFKVLRLSPYQCVYIWSDIKRQIRIINPIADMDMNKLLRETEQARNKTSNDRWQSYCKHVKKFELKYLEKDAIIEEMCESLQISLMDDKESDIEYDSEATISAESEDDNI